MRRQLSKAMKSVAWGRFVADFWVSLAKVEKNRRSRVSARKAKKGLARARRRLDQELIREQEEDNA